MHPTLPRRWHLLTAVVAAAALVLQLVLVVRGTVILTEEDPPGLAARLGRFVSYFTVQSNLLVALVCGRLAQDPAHDGRGWRVLRLAAIVGITVTGVVHFLLLRPLLDLDGLDRLADTLLHLVVPMLAVAGWLAFGPRPRVSWPVLARAVLWPLGWLVWTIAIGALSGWYPYPFLDVDLHGGVQVALTCAVVAAAFVALGALAAVLDRRLPPAPR